MSLHKHFYEDYENTYHVTGVWKMDQNVTLSLFHFIYTQPMYSCITRLS